VRKIFEQFQDFDLVGKQVFMHVTLDEAQVDHLDGYLLICIDICEYLSVRYDP
jgi:hypothetical protein